MACRLDLQPFCESAVLVPHQKNKNRTPKTASSPVPLSDLYFDWFYKPVASIVSRDRGTVSIIYVLFPEPITNGVWTTTGVPKTAGNRAYMTLL